MALSGKVEVRATSQNNLIFSWTAEQSISGNSSVIRWQLLLEAKQYGKIIATPGSPWSVTIAGETFTGTSHLAIENNQTKELAYGSKTITHSADGTGSFSFSFKQEFWINFDNEYITVVSGSGSAELDTIARVSQPSVSTESVDMEEVLKIYTNRPVGSGLTHTLAFSFGNTSGTIARDVEDFYQWRPPMELAYQIPKDESGMAVITCTTYAGDEEIGSNQVTVILTVPASVVPTASFEYHDISGASDRVDDLVQNVTKLSVDTSDSSGAYGSEITGRNITLNGRVYGGGVITESGNLSLTVTVTDSRGRVGVSTRNVWVAPYGVPSLTLSASRYDGNGNPDDSGGMAKITVSGYVTDINGRNSGTLDLSWSTGSERVQFEAAGDIQYQKSVEADINDTMTITAVLTDKLASSSRAMVLSTGYATLDLLAGGKGISLGKAATMEGFDCAMKACFREGLFEIKADGTTDNTSLFDRVAALEAKLQGG